MTFGRLKWSSADINPVEQTALVDLINPTIVDRIIVNTHCAPTAKKHAVGLVTRCGIMTKDGSHPRQYIGKVTKVDCLDCQSELAAERLVKSNHE